MNFCLWWRAHPRTGIVMVLLAAALVLANWAKEAKRGIAPPLQPQLYPQSLLD